jgi:hypothetical protein
LHGEKLFLRFNYRNMVKKKIFHHKLKFFNR